ncbi:MAG: diguanylate cyclase [Chitinivibrionales bacterium]|nr:diguanylate cyclase [Chitinivibrionales bacterium]MBD3395438.1 diguanylate cyclase [Chitinivibrionales bacterium]
MGTVKGTRILILEKEERNAAEVRSLLDEVRGTSFEVRSTPKLAGVLSDVKKGRVDVVALDLSYQKECYADTIRQIRTGGNSVPIVVMADGRDESEAIRAFHSGAQDYLIRGSFDGLMLAHVVRSAKERQRIVTELEQKSQEFQANEARLLNVVSSNADGIVVVNKDNVVQFMNPAAKRLFGRKAGGMLGEEFAVRVSPGATEEYTVERAADKDIVVEMRAVRTEWEGKDACLVSMRDITARKRADLVLRRSEERYALAVRGSKDGLWDWNLKTDEVYYSSTWKEMVGCEPHEMGTSPNEWFKRVHKEDLERLRADIAAHLGGATPHFESEHRLRHQDGTYRWVLSRGTAIRDARGKAIRIAGSQSNITERKEAEKNLRQALGDLKYALASEKVLLDELDKKNRELVELSITDGLTGLFNHRFIQERFDFEFKRAKRYDVLLSCMLLDIDHFKKVNDTYGHQFGDFVLREIAGIIKANSRDVDICGRYGGEEFMIISNQDENGAMQFASKLHGRVEGHEFRHEGQVVRVTVSIGVASYTRDVLSKQELIERADTAMYRAKEDGRNLIRVWKPQETEDESTLDKGGIADLKERFVSLSNQMRETYMESTYALLRAVDAKDHYTYQHSQNVSRYSVACAKAMGLPEEDIEVVRYAGLLHDIGKVGVDERILVKKGPLTYDEFEILKKHPVIGVNILKDVQFLEKEAPIILHHHERFDGNGYPQGLRGREIPAGARIMAVADAFDAMTTDREFKRKLSYAEAVRELEKGSGTQFAPKVVKAFVSVVREQLSEEENRDGSGGVHESDH